MLRLVTQRLLALVPLLFIVSVLTFSFTSLLPSDPVDLILGDVGTNEQYEMLRERLDGRWAGEPRSEILPCTLRRFDTA